MAAELPLSSLSRLIRRCRSMKQLHQIHAHVIIAPHLAVASPDSTVSFLLSRLLFCCATSPSGSLHYAVALFRAIPDPDLFAYNTMIRALAGGRGAAATTTFPHDSLPLYRQMLRRGVQPDHLTFPFLIRCCTCRKDPLVGSAIHAHVVRFGFEADLYVGNTLISMYAACRLPDGLRQVFEKMPKRDIVSWNSILIGYLRCGELDAALALFMGMEKRNTVTWNSIITGFVQGGRAKEALDLFHEMQYSGDGGVRPDKVTVASVISACAALGALDQGRWVHGYLKSRKLDLDVVIGTALIDMYGKCGCLERAMEVFDQEIEKKDVLAWTAMVSACAVNGQGEEALRLLFDMERRGVRPNHVTFGAVLSACAHSGMVAEGRWCFDMMQQKYSVEPNAQHYACMAGLLGRAGLFEDAMLLIRSMPVEPDVFVWGALLGACQMHGNLVLGERIASYLIELDPSNHAFYVVLSDLYAKGNKSDDVKRIWAFMRTRGIKKLSPGCSMIEVDGQVQEFSVNGAAEIAMEEILRLLNGIGEQLKSVGHVFNISEFPEPH
ncbi:hypothetical protein Taro_056051 [Colocasia esculenta]|uniref:Pentatricopeptide repeat-containing protein n=1 Tax=Colocasia esculenta TaxID=4460 RepID=A0A843XVF8_COLES|nr:hypothetical protein [Colocasia esculenta]